MQSIVGPTGPTGTSPPGASNPLGTTTIIAGQYSFLGWDLSEQFRVATQPGSLELLVVYGGRTGQGGTLASVSVTSINVMPTKSRQKDKLKPGSD